MRFYEPEIQKESLDNAWQLTAENSHHFNRFTRENWQEIVLCDGRGVEYSAKVLRIEQRYVYVRVMAYQEKRRGPRVSLSLVAFCQKQKMAFILEKAVELGVGQIHPVITQRTQIHRSNQMNDATQSRYNKIMISAAMQSGLSQIPILHKPVKISQIDWNQWQCAQCYLCHPEAQPIVWHQEKSEHRVLFVGPEGGWTEHERAILKLQGCRPMALANTVLRMETAVIVALAQAYQI